MAGKKKSKVEDTAGMSKTARASALKKGGKQEGFQPSGELDRVYSLNGGNYARILGLNGKSYHVRVGTGAYYDAVQTLLDAPSHTTRTTETLKRLGFPFPIQEDNNI